MEMVEIGGMRQSIWFRGRSIRNPALVLLHGGPGISEAPLFRRFNAALEERFLVVYWEQRGAGRSFRADIPPSTMTLSRLLRDLDEVVDLVHRRFGKRRVVLLGHSWGTVLGTMYAARHPAKVAAYVGVAQIADVPEQRRLSYEFALSQARMRGNARALRDLIPLAPAPRTVDGLLTLGTWTERFGGMFHADLSTGGLIWAALMTDEADVTDLARFGRGNRFSLQLLEDEIAELRLGAHFLSFEVPVIFMLGRHDRHVPPSSAVDYFEKLRAPFKRLVWFERSAHNPPFEEPELFNRVLVDEVLPLADGDRARWR
jgi:pimeloyl-ACP methyl ester carboxylesterase